MCTIKMISMLVFGDSGVPTFVYTHVTDPGPYVKNITAFNLFFFKAIGV